MKARAILLVFICLAGCQPASGQTVRLGKTTYAIEVMRTPAQREKGLIGHAPLNVGQGMLFVFDAEGIYPFWMKNMTFAIDMIWLDAQKKVVHIETNVPPCTADPCAVYTPARSAKYVLEVPPGDTIQQNIRLETLARF